MPTYQVVNKRHLRAMVTEEQVADHRGNLYFIRNQGAPTYFEVGALLDDVTEDELAAFPDRFLLMEEHAARAARAAAAAEAKAAAAEVKAADAAEAAEAKAAEEPPAPAAAAHGRARGGSS